MKTKKSSFKPYLYEILLLIRQRWLHFLGLSLLIIVFFAVYNGKHQVEQRIADIQNAEKAVFQKDSLGIILLDSIDAGFIVDVPPWFTPDQLGVIGDRYPRVAAMPPNTMAAIASGQSDIYTHYVKPKLYGESFELNYTELSNPVQLMFGSFDMSFVLIYLLPLIVIAFSYNILSHEREQGILKVIASHPISLFSWLLKKALIRYVLLAGLINVRGESSANNALWLIALWILFVLLIPSSVNQMANSLYPVSSRAHEIDTDNSPPPETPTTIMATKIIGRINVDGRLDEPAWQNAEPITDLFRVEPVQGGNIKNRTTVCILYDDKNLHVGVFATDSLEKKGVRMQDLRRDFDRG